MAVLILYIILDVGGILFKDITKELFQGIAKKYGLPVDMVLEGGDAVYRQYDCQPLRLGETWEQQERRFWTDFITGCPEFAVMNVEDLIEFSKRFIRPIEGTIPILERLASSGVILCILSNNTKFFFERQKSMWPKRVRRFFEGREIISCDVGIRKPDDKIFEAAVAATGASSLFIDDSPKNVSAANDFGLPAVLCPSNNPQALNQILKERGL